MTHKWLTIGLKHPRIPEFYTALIKIHKKIPVADQSFLVVADLLSIFLVLFDLLLQSIAQKQEPYLKDTTDFINFIKNTQISDHMVLATLDVSSLYTNIPQTEGIEVICRQYEDHYENNFPIPTNDLRELLRLILSSFLLLLLFKFNERHFIQTHGVPMGTKTAVALSVIFMDDLGERLLMASPYKPLVWKRFIDDIFSLWDIPMKEVYNFVDFANKFHNQV